MAEPTRYFIYTRKSTDVEDKQVRSIEAQLTELREFALKNDLTVVAEYIEKESAKTPGQRRIFNSMLTAIESGVATGILSWHPDRLARNMTDGGRIIDLIDTEKLSALKFPTFWFEPTPQGKFMLSMAFSQGKYYVDTLSENTSRGLREKVRNGQYPGLAPFGYLNDVRTKTIVIDPAYGPLATEIFNRFAANTFSIEDVQNLLDKRGVRSRTGKRVPNTFVTNFLKNPFYYGHFRYAGDVYEGKHPPLITKEVFNRVEAVFSSRWRYSPKEERPAKAFVGLLRCSECGLSITSETQKGHIYYRCTKKKRSARCSQPYIREDALESQITNLLLPYSLSKTISDWMYARLDADEKDAFKNASTMISGKRSQIAKIELRLKNLVDMRLDGEIDAKSYFERRAALMSQKKTLEEQISSAHSNPKQWLEPFKKWVSEATNLDKIAESESLLDKKALAKKIFGSNLVLEGRKARGEAVKPWAILTVNELSHDMVHLYEAARTYFTGEHGSQQ